MASPVVGCPFAYPERFERARAHVDAARQSGTLRGGDEAALVLEALCRQVSRGPCDEPRPSAWNAQGRALWQAWNHLGAMTTEDAMRLYVKQLEMDEPEWWRAAAVEAAEAQQAQAGSAVDATSESASESEDAEPAAITLPWAAMDAVQGGGPGPKPRFEHCAFVAGGAMIVAGGRSGGRYLTDCWAFDIARRAWSPVQTTGLPALAGAVAVPAAQSPMDAFLVGGHAKPGADRQPRLAILRASFDPSGAGHSANGNGSGSDAPAPPALPALRAAPIEAFGDAPTARGGHSANRIGTQIFVFGGEETLDGKRVMGDLHAFDLHSSAWLDLSGRVEGVPPSPRSAHSATVLADRYLVIFGGGSVAR